MAVSVFDLFSVGIGPSSSHTVGPMRAARMFALRVAEGGLLDRVSSVRAELFGSLGATGHGHGTPKAVLLGLEGETPEAVDVAGADERAARIHAGGRLRLLAAAPTGPRPGGSAQAGAAEPGEPGPGVGVQASTAVPDGPGVGESAQAELVGRGMGESAQAELVGRGMGESAQAELVGPEMGESAQAALDVPAAGESAQAELVGPGAGENTQAELVRPGAGESSPRGGRDVAVEVVLHRRRALAGHPNGMTFVALDGDGAELLTKTYFSVGGGFVIDEGSGGVRADDTALPYGFSSGAELLALTGETGWSVSRLMMANEQVWRSEGEIRAGLLGIWDVMRECVDAGLAAEGILPGGLKVRRRAAATARQLRAAGRPAEHAMEWLTAYAMAVNEENAAGGRVVTAPTNGAAGIIPAVLRYYTDFVPGASPDGVVRFLLAAAAVGLLFKENASISGAEVGCQGEVGSACAMAAAGLTEVLGGTPEQVENAAEIGMEHNLGLTCDPVGGLVQIPCIERNGMAAVKAVTAARMALRGDGRHHVSLDKVIKTMKETGADMKIKYKETARGGLAVNVIEC
ncbi:L-serine ammonia-lyase [Actinoplanes sp. NPDC049596]|uniref:L-serine ammonia-lyase n=1 Tax=unclassified Actinoplanes TaxID=2626549 RepID=UPI00342149E1